MMKKQSVILNSILLMAGLMLGCAGTAKEQTEPAAAEETQMNETEDVSVTEAASAVETADSIEYTEPEVKEEYVVLPNPSFSYYRSDKVQEKELAAIYLIKNSEEPNEIIDEDQWFQENGLTKQGFPYEDEAYRYEPEENVGQPVLELTELSTGKRVVFDLKEYQYGTEYVADYFDYIDQNLLYAAVKDNVLYLATGHCTYAAFCPQTAYITAVDLTDNSVLWKTEPLTCNARSFALVDDYLICGYGFTAEDDYLKIVRTDTGEVVQEIPVKTAPDYIIWQDGILYVRTYDTNYTFMIAAE